MAQMRVIRNDQGILIMEGEDSVLQYQAKPKSLNGAYTRANYIHPLYSLDGSVLTEDFPPDHPHQRGIFWAWHQLYLSGKRIGDGWETKDINWKVDTLFTFESASQDTPVGIYPTVYWQSDLVKNQAGENINLIEEQTQILVYPKQDDYRLIQITIQLLALHDDMMLGGAENEKGYGGFSVRMRLPEGTKFSGSKGTVIPDNLPVHAGNWIDISGQLELENELSGITILQHPDNPGFPGPWILREKKSMQNAVFPYPGKKLIPFPTDSPITLKYRLIIHRGRVSDLDLEALNNR